MRSCGALRVGTCMAAVLVAGACASDTGLNPDQGTSQVRVTLQRTDAIPLTFAVAAEPGEAMAVVPRANIEALTVSVLSVELLSQCEDPGAQQNGQQGQNGDGDCEWVPIAVLDAQVTLDLLNLPTEDDSPIVLAAGDVPAGDYTRLRIFIEGGAVNFLEPFSVGKTDYNADDDYAITIPSADNTGIKVSISLSVADGNADDVQLLFDEGATFRNVVATGSGMIKVPPVLKARPLS